MSETNSRIVVSSTRLDSLDNSLFSFLWKFQEVALEEIIAAGKKDEIFFRGKRTTFKERAKENSNRLRKDWRRVIIFIRWLTKKLKENEYCSISLEWIGLVRFISSIKENSQIEWNSFCFIVSVVQWKEDWILQIWSLFFGWVEIRHDRPTTIPRLYTTTQRPRGRPMHDNHHTTLCFYDKFHFFPRRPFQESSLQGTTQREKGIFSLQLLFAS